MVRKICTNCHEEKEHHAKGLCYSCYKKLKWQPKLGKCKRCKREMAIHAKGLCAGCYNYVFHLESNKAYHQRKQNKVDLKTFRKTTESCAMCEFNKIVDIHHIDANKQNNSPKNLVGLCPNHHRMIHNFKFRNEIFQALKEKGFDLPLDEKLDFHKQT
jgi:hypothetical protein